jgi:hypothetical protein
MARYTPQLSTAGSQLLAGTPSRQLLASRDDHPSKPPDRNARIERAAADKSVERVVLQLNTFCKGATFSFALSVGKLIIDTFYEGSLERWRSRDVQKDYSLRKLARHPSLPMSAGALYRSIAIYELTERLDLRSWRHVSTSHLRLVLPCAPDQQTSLLRAAEANRWSVRQLDGHVATVLGAHPERRDRGGRRRASALRRTTRAVGKLVALLNNTVEADDEAYDASPETARDAVRVLREAVLLCSNLEQRVNRALRNAVEENAPSLTQAQHPDDLAERHPDG